MTEQLSVAQQAEALAHIAIERAAQLARADAEKATRLAVERAVRDAGVDRDLRDHERQLRQINGSQHAMAKSLDALETSFSELTVSNQAIATYVGQRSTDRLSKRTLWIGSLAAVATWLAILATLLTALL